MNNEERKRRLTSDQKAQLLDLGRSRRLSFHSVARVMDIRPDTLMLMVEREPEEYEAQVKELWPERFHDDLQQDFGGRPFDKKDRERMVIPANQTSRLLAKRWVRGLGQKGA